jgi:hypothetical protein
MQMLVLGMHRSGTSAVVRLLNMMGASLGPPDRIKGANPENPKGFWENDDVVALNNDVLGAQRCLWNRIADFDPSRLHDEALATLHRRAKDLVIALDTCRPWAVKDPRMCLVLPFWRELLELPVCVLVNRAPLEVARSLRTRNDMPLHIGIALWERYTLEALRGSAGLPRLLVQYAELIRDPVATTRSLLDRLTALGVRKLECPPNAEIRAFIDEDLHRQRADEREQTDFLTPPQQCLAGAMADGSALDLSEVPRTSASAQEVLRGYEITLQAQGRVQQLKGMLADRDRASAELRESAERLRQQIDQAKAHLEQNREAIQQLETQRQAPRHGEDSAFATRAELNEIRLEVQRLADELARLQDRIRNWENAAGKTQT